MFTFFWLTHIVEGREWLAQLLARQTDAPPTLDRAWAISVAAALAGHDGDDVAARYFAQEYLTFPEAFRTDAGLGLAHGALRQAALREGDLPGARHDATVALAAAVEANEIARPFYRVNLGEVALAEGHLEEAHRLFQEAMSEARPRELPAPIGLALDGLARIARARGDLDLAVALNEQALGFLHAHADVPQAALVHVSLASLALERDDFESARTHLRHALDTAVERGYRQSLVAAIAAAALTLVKQAPRERTRIELAVSLAEGARVLQAETAPTAHGSAEAATSIIAHAREVLGATYTDALVSQARALSMDELVAQSRVALTDLRNDPQGHPGQTPKLSPREKQVAALIGKGYSNQQIADVLVIGRRTAEMHVGNVLRKLGLESRAQLAVWAVQHGLVDSPAHPD
jgi:DNA-binding CsgD family transcriptional regulator